MIVIPTYNRVYTLLQFIQNHSNEYFTENMLIAADGRRGACDTKEIIENFSQNDNRKMFINLIKKEGLQEIIC